MFTKRIIPCLDVNDGRVVKGVNFVNLRDAGDPVEIAAAYDKAGADEVVFLDITASCEQRDTVVDMVRKVAANVFIRNFHRISCILQVYEINTFHYSSIIYIQAGNNSLCKHNYASFPSFAKFSSIFRPYLLLFSGWNWQANMLSFSTEA